MTTNKLHICAHKKRCKERGQEIDQDKDGDQMYDQIVLTIGRKRGSKRRALFRRPKKNSEPTQNWCCQSFHAD
jgi:hypothetical protein